MKTRLYDPVEFIKENTYKILPENSTAKNIKFSGFTSKLFHSGDRPGGKLTIIYSQDSEEKKLQLFVKQHADAIKVFDQMSHVHGKLNHYNMAIHMPKPYICDVGNNVNYMEFISGTALTYPVLSELIFRRTNKLTDLFSKIGQWLKNYHQISDLKNKITITEIKKNIITALNNTSFFNNAEKKRIAFRLENLIFQNTSLILVKPHNDFAMRNIIYEKPNFFKVIDWDAMFHKEFASESPIWNDITSFITHVNSLQRFSPVITRKELKILTGSFLQGYFNDVKNPSYDKEIKNHLYLFTLCSYLGIIGDRALPEIYRGKFGHRYIKDLHKLLLDGKI